MINVLLDPLPDTYVSDGGEEYRINTGFRVGIQINLIQNDSELNEKEKSLHIIRLLFQDKDGNFIGKIPQSAEEAEEILVWFLTGWNHDGKSHRKVNERLTDFDVDQWRIFSEFYAKYGINLNLASTQMHYWQFMGMLGCLDGSYSRVIQIRQQEIDPKLPAKDREIIADAKRVYHLSDAKSKEDAESEEAWLDLLGGTDKEPEIDEQEQKYIDDFMQYAEEVND